MKLQVDFYKESGKWYEGGVVDVGDAKPFVMYEVEQAIVDNQHILYDGWQGGYYVVINNVEPFIDEDSFCMRLYTPSKFHGIKKGN
jgi:hypothetical protein